MHANMPTKHAKARTFPAFVYIHKYFLHPVYQKCPLCSESILQIWLNIYFLYVKNFRRPRSSYTREFFVQFSSDFAYFDSNWELPFSFILF